MTIEITVENKLKKLIVVGDRVLIKLKKESGKTLSGLYLPPGIKEKEQIQYGYIVKTGPGYMVPLLVEDEDWKPEEEKVKYVPLQAREGDLAIFLQKGGFEVMYKGEKFHIVPQASILMLEREEDLLD